MFRPRHTHTHTPSSCVNPPGSRLSIAFPRHEGWWRGLKSLLTKGKSNYFLFSAALAAHSHLGGNQRVSLFRKKKRKRKRSARAWWHFELSLNFAKSCELVNQPRSCAGIKHTLTSPEPIHTHTHRDRQTRTHGRRRARSLDRQISGAVELEERHPTFRGAKRLHPARMFLTRALCLSLLHVFLLLARGSGGNVLGLLVRRQESGADENVPRQNVDEEAHEGERAREDAHEEFGWSSASAPGLPASCLQPQRATTDQDPDSQIHHRVHKGAVGNPQPRMNRLRHRLLPRDRHRHRLRGVQRHWSFCQISSLCFNSDNYFCFVQKCATILM